MKQTPHHSDQRYRSLLQKAVRRGYSDLIIELSALIDDSGAKERSWYKSRTVVIAFEECWPLAERLDFNRSFASKVKALVKVARTTKFKDAAGLGTLAYALSMNDRSVLNGSDDDRHIKIVASGIRRPDAFWDWIVKQPVPALNFAVIDNAKKYRNVGWPWDKAFVQAGAYLAALGNTPEVSGTDRPERPENDFPFWVALDRHTPQGKQALFRLSSETGVPVQQMEWSNFYFEGAKTDACLPSEWWDREIAWRLKTVDLSYDESKKLWNESRPGFMALLAEESDKFVRDFNEWKERNIETVEKLRNEVMMDTKNLPTKQKSLFGF